MALNEEAEALLFLQSFLSADATLSNLINGVYLRSVPERVRTPLVKMDVLERGDLMVVNGKRVWSAVGVLVRGVDQSDDWTDVNAIAVRIDALLFADLGSNAAVHVQDVVRTEPFSDETIEAGDLYVHSGGLYSMKVQAV